TKRMGACRKAAAAYGALSRKRPRHALEVFTPGYATSDRCESCHDRQYESWSVSHHRTMTQAPSPRSVAGDFSGAPMTFDGVTLRAFRQGDAFWFEMGGERLQVALVTGSHHEQVYWYETGKGKQLKMFPLLYRISERRWVPDYAIFLKPRDRFLPEE